MNEIGHHICKNENPNEIAPDSVENPVLIEGGHHSESVCQSDVQHDIRVFSSLEWPNDHRN